MCSGSAENIPTSTMLTPEVSQEVAELVMLRAKGAGNTAHHDSSVMLTEKA